MPQYAVSWVQVLDTRSVLYRGRMDSLCYGAETTDRGTPELRLEEGEKSDWDFVGSGRLCCTSPMCRCIGAWDC